MVFFGAHPLLKIFKILNNIFFLMNLKNCEKYTVLLFTLYIYIQVYFTKMVVQTSNLKNK